MKPLTTLLFTAIILTGCTQKHVEVQPMEIKIDSLIHYKMLYDRTKEMRDSLMENGISGFIYLSPEFIQEFYEKDSNGVSDYDRELIKKYFLNK